MVNEPKHTFFNKSLIFCQQILMNVWMKGYVILMHIVSTQREVIHVNVKPAILELEQPA